MSLNSMFPLNCNEFITVPSSVKGSIFDFLSITAKTFLADPRADAKTSMNGGSLEMFSADVTKFKNTFMEKKGILKCIEHIITNKNFSQKHSINHTVINTGMVYALVVLSLSASTH